MQETDHLVDPPRRLPLHAWTCWRLQAHLRTALMQGRRLEDTVEGTFPLPYDDLREGDIWRVLDRETGDPKVVTGYPSNLTGEHWMCLGPGRLFGNLLAHTVRSHDDGTVSVRPGDGSSNSILIGEGRPDRPSWHGYIDHNDWQPC